jgi:hypothetical protein
MIYVNFGCPTSLHNVILFNMCPFQRRISNEMGITESHYTLYIIKNETFSINYASCLHRIHVFCVLLASCLHRIHFFVSC